MDASTRQNPAAPVAVGSTGELVDLVAERVHAVASQGPPRLSSYTRRLIGAWESRDLVAVVEAMKYGSRNRLALTIRLSRPAGALGHLPAANELVVRLGVRPEGARWWSTGVDDAARGAALWLRAARRSTRTRASREQHWCIDPAATPREVTVAVLGLYLWRAGLVDAPAPGDWHWRAWKGLLPSLQRAHDGVVFEILDRMRQRFALPVDWKGLRVYLSRVGWTVRGVRPAEGKARALGVSRATFYRWRGSLSPKAIETKAAETIARQKLMDYLTDVLGRKKEAARKFIQRGLAQGESLDQIRRRLRVNSRERPGCGNRRVLATRARG